MIKLTSEELKKTTNKMDVPCICDYCGCEFTRNKKSLLRNRKITSKDACNGKCTQKKKEESNIKIYGVKCYIQNKDFPEKMKKTMLERYGVEHFQGKITIY